MSSKQDSANNDSNVTEQASRFLIRLLRHTPEEHGISLNSRGWASVKDVRNVLQAEFGDGVDLLNDILDSDDKNRFQLVHDSPFGFIRATRKHTADSVDLLPLYPENVNTYLVKYAGNRQDEYVKAESPDAVQRVVTERRNRHNIDWENTEITKIGDEDEVTWGRGRHNYQDDDLAGMGEPHRILDQRADEYVMVEKRANMAGDKGRYVTMQPERVRSRREDYDN